MERDGASCTSALIVFQRILEGQVLQIGACSHHTDSGRLRDALVGRIGRISDDRTVHALPYQTDIMPGNRGQHTFAQVVETIGQQDEQPLGSRVGILPVGLLNGLQEALGIAGFHYNRVVGGMQTHGNHHH